MIIFICFIYNNNYLFLIAKCVYGDYFLAWKSKYHLIRAFKFMLSFDMIIMFLYIVL